jgi:hypothetical protein
MAGNVKALKQFEDDWAHRTEKGASVRIPDYGVIAHGICTSSMYIWQFETVKAGLLQESRPIIPAAEIEYIR